MAFELMACMCCSNDSVGAKTIDQIIETEPRAHEGELQLKALDLEPPFDPPAEPKTKPQAELAKDPLVAEAAPIKEFTVKLKKESGQALGLQLDKGDRFYLGVSGVNPGGVIEAYNANATNGTTIETGDYIISVNKADDNDGTTPSLKIGPRGFCGSCPPGTKIIQTLANVFRHNKQT